MCSKIGWLPSESFYAPKKLKEQDMGDQRLASVEGLATRGAAVDHFKHLMPSRVEESSFFAKNKTSALQ